MTTQPTATLEMLERTHADLLAKAEQAPASSAERERLLREADRALQAVNDFHEKANPTPFA